LSKDAIQAVFTRIPVWAEQSCRAALVHRAGCGPRDAACIAVVDADWSLDRRAVAAHFVSSSPHRLAEVLRQIADADALNPEPVKVPVIESRECSAFELGRSPIARLRRPCGF